MNEEQGYELLRILQGINNKMDVLVPKNAIEEKQFRYLKLYVERMRYDFFDSLNDKQKTLFLKIEKEIQKEVYG